MQGGFERSRPGELFGCGRGRELAIHSKAEQPPCAVKNTLQNGSTVNIHTLHVPYSGYFWTGEIFDKSEPCSVVKTLSDLFSSTHKCTKIFHGNDAYVH